MKMTLEEAIKHEYKIADQLTIDAICIEDAYQTGEQKDRELCAEKHIQIAEWLTQLSEIKAAFDKHSRLRDSITTIIGHRLNDDRFLAEVVEILMRGDTE